MAKDPGVDPHSGRSDVTGSHSDRESATGSSITSTKENQALGGLVRALSLLDRCLIIAILVGSVALAALKLHVHSVGGFSGHSSEVTGEDSGNAPSTLIYQHVLQAASSSTAKYVSQTALRESWQTAVLEHLPGELIEVRTSKTGRGLGLFASYDILSGQLIETCPLMALSKKSPDPNQRAAAHFLSNYVWDVSDKDGEALSALALCKIGTMANHRDDHNVEVHISGSVMMTRATEDIKKGEELFVLYDNTRSETTNSYDQESVHLTFEEQGALINARKQFN